MSKTYFILVAMFAALLGGCGDARVAPGPASILGASALTFTSNRPSEVQQGLYLSSQTSNPNTWAFSLEKGQQGQPLCALKDSLALAIATDPAGDVAVEFGNYNVDVYAGPNLCGPLVGSVNDKEGYNIFDVATRDALNGPIYIANQHHKHFTGHGSVAVCTLAKGCTKYLSSSAIHGEGVSVAVDVQGNLYFLGYDKGRGPRRGVLAFFPGGNAPGVQLSAYGIGQAGGLDIDKDGNLIAMDLTGNVYVFSGCPSACVQHGPFPLQFRGGYFGKVTPDNKRLLVHNASTNSVDVYRYRGIRGVEYLYTYAIESPYFNGSGIAVVPPAH